MSFAVTNTTGYLTEEAIAYLETNECRITNCQFDQLTEEAFSEEIRGIDAVIASGEQYTEKVFQAADKLKIVARTGTGYERVDIEAATKHGIWVTTTPGATSHAVSDFTLGLMLSLLRNIPAMAQEMKDGQWNQFAGKELASLTVGIVGAGSIGQEVIKRTTAFGAKVLAYDIQPDDEFADQWNVQYLPLDELMTQSDIISLHVSFNEGTRGLIDQRRLKLMKKGAYLINTSRPAVVDKEALIRVLKAKEIAGAAIDVHAPDPCPPDDPLVQLDNVIATPWTAYKTEETIARMCIMAATDVVTVLHGGAPQFPVNKL
jgi:phosphoglycerate dehydrogenase-like enzyme